MSSLPESLLGWIADDEAVARAVPAYDRFDPARVLRECAAKRRIVELHESWPVMIEGPPEFTPVTYDVQSMTFQMSQKIAWLTTQEYRARFGDEPPSGPMLRAVASVYSDRPNFDPDWAL